MRDLTFSERRRAELMHLMPAAKIAARPTPWGAIKAPLTAAALVIGVFFGGFVGWASYAPLESAVIAKGNISPAGSRRTVQHLEGGVISKINVRDGDMVRMGQTLLTMNDTQSDAAYRVSERRLLAQRAVLARLQAERANASNITWPDEVMASLDPDLRSILRDQQNFFETRRNTVKSQQAIYEQQASQLREQIGGYNQQVTSVARQLELIASETRDVQGLVNKGLERRTRLLALERAAAGLDGQKAAILAATAQAQQKIGEIQLQMAGVETARRNEVDDQIAKAQTEIVQLSEQMRAQNDVRARAQIVAPVDGTVVNLRFKNEGGVIQPGEAVLDIVPRDEDLIIDAHISPMDIDSVKIGQMAEVLLPSYRLKFMPRTVGEVTYVSADSLRDANTGANYYEVKVRVPPAEKAKLDAIEPPVKLVAGMPAEVFVVTGEAYVMAYLLNPLTEMVRRTFRETDGL